MAVRILAGRLCLGAGASSLRPRTPILGSARGGSAGWIGSHAPTARVFVTSARRRREHVARGAAQTTAQASTGRTTGREQEVRAERRLQGEAEAKDQTLLAEQTVSHREQRRADWAIVRDMAHYLWPRDDVSTRFRVGLSLGLLVGAKVRLLSDSLRRRVDVDGRVCA